jgi:hypothetical protein
MIGAAVCSMVSAPEVQTAAAMATKAKRVKKVMAGSIWFSLAGGQRRSDVMTLERALAACCDARHR